MYEHILVPVDGSALGARALRYAIPLAEQHGARITMLHVWEPLLARVAGKGAPVADLAMDAEWRAIDRADVERIARRARRQTSAKIDIVYREGRPAPTISQFAVSDGVGLVVMCTHGRGGFERLWLGSVADALIRHLTVPTLLVRARGAMPDSEGSLFPRVMVALDGSERAERALLAAVEMIGDRPCELKLFSVAHPLTAVGAKEHPSPAEKELMASYLEPLAAQHRTERRHVDVSTALDANVSRAILDHARVHNVAMVAMATQGLGGVQRLVVGSVADKLLRSATMPLLVVP